MTDHSDGSQQAEDFLSSLFVMLGQAGIIFMLMRRSVNLVVVGGLICLGLGIRLNWRVDQIASL